MKTSERNNKQAGAALVISLILLVIITFLSITSMRSATLNSRIAINHQHKQLAFQAAENALTRLTTLRASQMPSLSVPSDVGAANAAMSHDFMTTNGTTKTSADLRLELLEASKPGKYKFSGYGLNIVTIIYRADAYGEVDGTPTRAHNRVKVALIRD